MSIDAAATTTTPRPTRGRLWMSALVLVTLVIVWSAAVGAAAVSARSDLLLAEEHVTAGRGALSEVDIPTAAEEFARAEDRAADGYRRLRWPHVRLAAAIPFAGDSVATAAGIAGGVAEVSAAARNVAEEILALPGGADALTPSDGVLPVHAMSALVPAFRSAELALASALQSVDAAPQRVLITPVADARDRFLELAEPAHRQAEIARDLVEQLPAFLGADRPRRYFLGSSNPAELRGSGGFIGAFAVMTLDGGQLNIGPWSQIHDLPNLPVEDVPAPNPDFAARYDEFGGAGFWMNINMTPDFPSAAIAIEHLWTEATGETLDGVMLVDPFAFEALLAVAGPVEVHERRIDADNVVDYVSNEAYGDFPSHAERKDVIGQLAVEALEGFLHSPDLDDLRGALDPLAAVVRDGHLLIHSADHEIQAAFTRIGLDGGLRAPGGDHIGVFVNNAAAAKQDFYVDRDLDYTVRLLPDGWTAGRLDLTFHNHTPSDGLSRHVIGPAEGLEAGQMHGLVSVFCAPGCEPSDAPSDHHGPPRVSSELGLPVIDTWLTVDSGQEATLTYTWRTAGAWEVRDDVLVYRFSHDDQVTIRPTSLRVRVQVPDGFEPRRLPEDARFEEGVVDWRRNDRGDVLIELELALKD